MNQNKVKSRDGRTCVSKDKLPKEVVCELSCVMEEQSCKKVPGEAANAAANSRSNRVFQE